jgi:hypothetical protein
MNKLGKYTIGPNESNDHFSPIHGCALTGSIMSAGVLSTSSSPLSIHAVNNLSTMNVSDININGISLKETLQKIEQRLNILAPNKELEAQWEELQELGEKYRKLEKELESYNKVWEILSTDK